MVPASSAMTRRDRFVFGSDTCAAGVDEHPRVLHRQPAGLEVDVDPPQAGDLASPHPGDEEQPPHRHEPIVGDERQEPADVRR